MLTCVSIDVYLSLVCQVGGLVTSDAQYLPGAQQAPRPVPERVGLEPRGE